MGSHSVLFRDTFIYMSINPRAALEQLTTALQEHLVAVSQKRGDNDPAVEAAYNAIADAFESYEDALFAEYDEVTPLDLYDVDDEEDEDVDDEEHLVLPEEDAQNPAESAG